MNSENILEIHDLAISFRTLAGTVNAIRGVNLDVKRGKTLAIVGESGSGKSVTVKSIAGIIAGMIGGVVGRVMERIIGPAIRPGRRCGSRSPRRAPS
jgi:oligopeptide transport system ATP-binding protein